SAVFDVHNCRAVVTFGGDALVQWACTVGLEGVSAVHHVVRAGELEPLSTSGLMPRLHSIITDTPPTPVMLSIDRPVFTWAGPRSSGNEARQVAVAIVQALSNVGAETGRASAKPAPANPRDPLPVWLYWEGDLPKWVEQCHATIFAHDTRARLL